MDNDVIVDNEIMDNEIMDKNDIIVDNEIMDKNDIIVDKKIEFKCQYCDRLLSSKRNLEIHEYNICKYSHKCLKCNGKFLSKKYLDRHMKLCIGELKCYKCSKVLTRKQTYLKHIDKCI